MEEWITGTGVVLLRACPRLEGQDGWMGGVGIDGLLRADGRNLAGDLRDWLF